jgi:hypothetical protein
MTDQDQDQDDAHRAEVIARLDRELDVAAQLCGVLRCLLPWCPVCGSDPGLSCRWVPWTEWMLLDGTHQLWGHQARIERAVVQGHVDRDTVLAQFGGPAFAPRWVQDLAKGANSTGTPAEGERL